MPRARKFFNENEPPIAVCINLLLSTWALGSLTTYEMTLFLHYLRFISSEKSKVFPI